MSDSLRLSREYIVDHVPPEESGKPEAVHSLNPSSAAPDSDSEIFAREFCRRVFQLAAEQIGNEELDEMTLELPVRLRPIAQPEGGCIGVNVGVVEWHGNYKGNHPGKG